MATRRPCACGHQGLQYEELAGREAEVLQEASHKADLEPVAKRQCLDSVVVTVKGPPG
jgi:hypothetical protein